MLQPYDMQMGAGTFHHGNLFAGGWTRALERSLRATLAPPEPTAATVTTHFACSTTINSRCAIKPSPDNFQGLYLGSLLRHLGFDLH